MSDFTAITAAVLIYVGLYLAAARISDALNRIAATIDLAAAVRRIFDNE